MLKSSLRTCLMALGALIVLLPGTALAQLHVCNETASKRSVAVGYKAYGSWISEGWWSLASGECKRVTSTALKSWFLYYRATAQGAFKGEGHIFCTDNKPFTIVGDDNCEGRGYAPGDFAEIEIGGVKKFTLTLTGAGAVAAPAPAADTIDLPQTVTAFGRELSCDLAEALAAWDVKAYGLDDGTELYLVPCQKGGVNTEHYLAMRRPGAADFRLYDFESPPGDDLANVRTIISPTFNPDTMQVRGTFYYSLNRDCGLFEVHDYVADGDFFELVEQREKVDCDGRNDSPEQWPLRWTIDEMTDEVGVTQKPQNEFQGFCMLSLERCLAR